MDGGRIGETALQPLLTAATGTLSGGPFDAALVLEDLIVKSYAIEFTIQFASPAAL